MFFKFYNAYLHALENAKDTDNQSELYFDQLGISTLGTAGNSGASATEIPVCIHSAVLQLLLTRRVSYCQPRSSDNKERVNS